MNKINYNRIALVLGVVLVVASVTIIAGEKHLAVRTLGCILTFGGITKAFWV